MPQFKTSDGLTLSYEDEGAGTPLLCLSGLTRNSRDFDHMAAALDLEDVRLIRLDYRGRGKSEYDPNYPNYSIPVEARDAVELLNHLNLPKAVIVGTSRGGLIAMVLAATVKDRLAGVLLNDIGPELEREGMDKIKGYLGRDPNYQTYAEVIADLPKINQGVFDNVPLDRWEACAHRWWKETPEGLRIDYDPKLREAVLEAEPATDEMMWSLFDALSGLPLALVRGANSDLLSQATADEMRNRRPDMAFTNVPDRGHVPFLDEPEALAALQTVLLKVDI